jgi:predicted ATPase/DNA-binding SARP family transcriptional activator
MKHKTPDLPSGPSISYSRQYRRCGKANCPACGGGGRGHGPYWYAFWYEAGRKRSRYLGKDAPAAALEVDTARPGVRAAGRRRAGSLQVQALGGFAVWRDGALLPPAHWRRRNVAALFKCLLGAPGHRLLREQLVDMLFSDREPAAGARALRATTYLLRQILDRPEARASHVQGDGDWLMLAPRLNAEPPADWLDADAFDRAAGAALHGNQTAACHAALALYTGEYLPDNRYEDWAQARREQLRLRNIALLLHCAALHYKEGEADEAVRCLRDVLAVDATNEDAARALMRAFAARGRYSEAFQVYRDLDRAVREELDDEPAPETRSLRLALMKALPAPVLAPPRRSNLPTALTSFVGRERERAAVSAALRPESGSGRLLTLLGAGGCGKTRLAIEVARDLEAAYRDGVWLVELARIAPVSGGIEPHVPEAVAGALGMRVEPSRPALNMLAEHLAPLRMLLVLDNCEHLIDSCVTLVTALLGAAPQLRVLATSQVPLGVLGETCLRVPSLSLPDAEGQHDFSELDGSEAVRLFVERARAARPGFELTPQNADLVARICRQLDGIPLALELAAVRLASLPLETIEARLIDRFRLLTGGNRGSLPRQQTLQATLDWSYGLLSAREQQVLRRLAVFAGGWDLASAEAVVGAGEIGDWELLDILEGLIVKSLVQLDDAGGSPRFRLLETVRHYARRHLEISGEAGAVSDRHLSYYVELVETLREALRTREPAGAAARLTLERDNASAALRWAREHGAQTLGLRLAIAMRRHWEMGGRLTEGREWLDALLVIDAPDTEQTSPPLLAQALNAAGLLAFGQGDYVRATTLHEQSLALQRDLGDREGTAATLNNLGNIAVRIGDYAHAEALYKEALPLFKALEHDSAVATVLNNLGSLAGDQGDHAQAAELYEASLAMRRAHQDVAGIAESLANLGHTAYARGDAARAESLLGESLALRRDLGDAMGTAESLRMLAQVALAHGDCVRAGDLYRESLALCRQADDLWGSAGCLLGLAAVSASAERFEDAVVLSAAAETLRQRIGAALAPADREGQQHVTTRARDALGEAAYAAALARARMLTPEAVVAQAIEPLGT